MLLHYNKELFIITSITLENCWADFWPSGEDFCKTCVHRTGNIWRHKNIALIVFNIQSSVVPNFVSLSIWEIRGFSMAAKRQKLYFRFIISVTRMENRILFTVDTAPSSMNTLEPVTTRTMSSVRRGRDIFQSRAISLIILQSRAIGLIILPSLAISRSPNIMISLPSRSLNLAASLILMKKSNLSPILDLFDDCCLFVSIWPTNIVICNKDKCD